MPTDHHLDPDEDALAQMGYETEDVEFKSLGRSIVWFFGFVVFCGIAGVIIFFLFLGGSPSGAWEALTKGPTDTAPFVSRVPAEGNPLLQTNVTARTDIRDLRREEDAQLNGKPSWVDRSKGIVRIPINQAIDEYLASQGGSAHQPTTMVSGAPPAGGQPPEEPQGNP